MRFPAIRVVVASWLFTKIERAIDRADRLLTELNAGLSGAPDYTLALGWAFF